MKKTVLTLLVVCLVVFSSAHAADGDVPLAIRALYVQYASEIQPDHEYRFLEHPRGGGGSGDKTFEDATFLERVRMLLVQEEGESL